MNLKPTNLVLGCLVGFVLTTLGPKPLSAQQVFDATADFSSSQKPNGVWQYGLTDSLGGTFQLLSGPGVIFGNSNLIGWGAAGESVVVRNETSQTQVASGLELLPGMLGQHPGSNGEFSVVRWTAPSSGIYEVDSAFETRDRNSFWFGEVHVLVNESSVLSFRPNFVGNRLPLGSTIGSFQSEFALSAGDTIDFVVGQGDDDAQQGDTTGLRATITAVPEPSAFLLGAISILGIATSRRRSRRQ